MRYLLVLLLGAAACTLTSRAPVTGTATTYGVQCTSREGLPDAVCTPGEADPRVTQANLASTICHRGYTASVRPPESVTYPIKVRTAKAYGLEGLPFSKIELDHLIPLSLGGASTEANLWPQLRAGPQDVGDKDDIAVRLNRRVCRGQESLAEAQHAMATNWEKAG